MLGADWVSFEANVTTKQAANLYIGIYTYYPDAGVGVANIKDLEIIDTVTNTAVEFELTSYADASPQMQFPGGFAGEQISHYTTKGAAAGAISPTISKYCDAGLYTITGKLSASDDTTVNATVNGTVYASVSVGKWLTDATLVIDIRESFNMEDIKLEFDSEYINFADLTIDEYIYTSLGNWVGENGEMLVMVEGSNDYQTFIPRGSISDAEGYWAQYKLADLAPGTYKFTGTLRYASTDSANLKTGFYAGVKGWYSRHAIFNPSAANKNAEVEVNYATLNGAAVDDQFPLLTMDWQTYESEFTVYSKSPLYIGLYRYEDSDYVAVDFKNISIVELSTGTEIEYTLESTGGSSIVYTDVSHYTTAGSGATSVSPAPGTDSDYVLSPGKYYITSTFRAHEADAIINAFANDVALYTVSGSTDVSLGKYEWRTVKFVLETRVDISTTDIRIAFDNDIDFLDNIEIELIERYVELSSINVGTIITLLMLKKDEYDAYDPINPFSTAITRTGANNWENDGQTITFVKNAEGNFLRVSDIKKNTDSIIYRPGVSIKRGTYIFNIEMRTANPGEKTFIRIAMGDKIIPKPLTNEWTKVELVLNIDKKQDLAIKIYGGSTAQSIQSFDFRNLSIINIEDIPGGYNFYPEGDFETEGTHGWVAGTGADTVTGKVKWMQEENGNGYLSCYDRSVGYSPAKVNLGINAVKGDIYTISYDIRASHEGDKFTVRSYMNNIGLIVENSNPDSDIEFDITHEWQHIETTFIPTAAGPLALEIKGGQSTDGPDDKDFDFDNVTIIKSAGVSEDDLYPAGTFDNKAIATSNWGTYWNHSATFTWNSDENGDGYITVSDRMYNHTPARLADPFELETGKTYIISYDIRATNEDEMFTVRSYVNNQMLRVSGASNSAGNEFVIDHNWRHIETSYFATQNDTGFIFSVQGGQTPEDNKSFDINNLKISIAD